MQSSVSFFFFNSCLLEEANKYHCAQKLNTANLSQPLTQIKSLVIFQLEHLSHSVAGGSQVREQTVFPHRTSRKAEEEKGFCRLGAGMT